MTAPTPVNRLLAPTGTADTTINQGGTLLAGGTSLTLTSFPSNWPASGLLRVVIYKVGDANHEFIDIDLGTRSTLTFTIARATEEATDLPASSHADGAGIWVVATAAMITAQAGSHSYLGYNTIGASQDTWTAANYKEFFKKITTPSDGLIMSIGAAIQQSTNSVIGFKAAVYSDVSGSPGVVLAYSQDGTGSGGTETGLYLIASTAPTYMPVSWIHRPIGLWLAAGDYWIVVSAGSTNTSTMSLSYDGSGSDRWANHVAGRPGFSAYTALTPTTTSNKYSIRASFLPA